MWGGCSLGWFICKVVKNVSDFTSNTLMTSIVHEKVDFCEKQSFVTKFKNQDLKILFCASFFSVLPTLLPKMKVWHHITLRMINLLARHFWKFEFIQLANIYLIKHEYLRSRAYICLSLSSPFSSSDRYPKFVLFINFLSSIEILVLLSWIPASKEFFLKKLLHD